MFTLKYRPSRSEINANTTNALELVEEFKQAPLEDLREQVAASKRGIQIEDFTLSLRYTALCNHNALAELLAKRERTEEGKITTPYIQIYTA